VSLLALPAIAHAQSNGREFSSQPSPPPLPHSAQNPSGGSALQPSPPPLPPPLLPPSKKTTPPLLPPVKMGGNGASSAGTTGGVAMLKGVVGSTSGSMMRGAESMAPGSPSGLGSWMPALAN